VLNNALPIITFPARSRAIQPLQTLDTLIQNPTILTSGTMLFIPDVEDSRFSRSEVTDNTLRINNKTIFDGDQVSSAL
jgi:hypothetical protein